MLNKTLPHWIGFGEIPEMPVLDKPGKLAGAMPPANPQQHVILMLKPSDPPWPPNPQQKKGVKVHKLKIGNR